MDRDFVAKGETNEDIMQQAAEHARTAHNNQNWGAMLISGAADTDNSLSVLPPSVSCRGGTEDWANPTVANSPSLMSSDQCVFFLSATNLQICQNRAPGAMRGCTGRVESPHLKFSRDSAK